MSFSEDLQPIHDEYLSVFDELEVLKEQADDLLEDHRTLANFDNECRHLQQQNQLGGKKYERWRSHTFRQELQESNYAQAEAFDKVQQKLTELSGVKDKVVATIYEHLVRDATKGAVQQGTIADISEALTTYNLNRNRLFNANALRNWVQYPLDDAIWMVDQEGWPAAKELPLEDNGAAAHTALGNLAEALGNCGSFMGYTRGLISKADYLAPIVEGAVNGATVQQCYDMLEVIVDRVSLAATTIQEM